PGVYELTEGETFADLVRMAGGPTGRTHLVRARVDRVLPPSRRAPGEPPAVTLDVPLADALAGRATFELDDLDDVVFAPVPADRGEFVVVRGNVWYPSTYEFRAGMRVADALEAAGGVRPDTFDGRAYLVRTRPDLTRETLTFDVGRVRAGDPTANVPLAARDEISIRSRWELFDRPTVSIAGAVRNPGEYELTDGLTVGELLVQAGGFLEYAWTDSVEVSRVYPEDGDARRIAETFRVPVGDDFLARAELPAFALQNHDRVFVRRQPFWELQRDVRVAGAVMYPGTYSLESQTERLATVIDRTGGLLENAYPEGFQLFRRQDDIGRVSADLARALEDRGSDANLVLVSGDSLYVPERPMTVRVSGAVNFPTSHVFRPGKGIGWYVENSGGYRDEAKKSGTTLVYSTGRAAKVRRWRPDPEVRPGSEIVVPAKIPGEGTDWGRVVVDIASVAASLATTWLVVDTIVGR
ncbi:MAG: SLBB domain-containing protein, partial [Gemmatimonadetes bacterium]|nr:SLBB domain-containing protein [Gemmatimonadota bacterium]